MTKQLDRTMIELWTDFTTIRKQIAMEDLDEKYLMVIYTVAVADAQGRKINQRDLVEVLKPKSRMTVQHRVTTLIDKGWLYVEMDSADRRARNLHITPKSLKTLNLLSASVKSAVLSAASRLI